jgi:hypothetical protein
MAGNGRPCRSRRDYAAHVARTVKAGALSPQHLMSRPASGWLTALLKRDVEQLKEAVAAPPSRMWVRSPMGAYRGLAAKCPTEGFRESLVRFRADRPPTSLTSVGRILSPFLGQSALARKQHHLFGLRQSAHWASSCNLVSSNLTPPRGARAEFVAPHVTHGRKRPQSVAGASPVRQFDSLGYSLRHVCRRHPRLS